MGNGLPEKRGKRIARTFWATQSPIGVFAYCPVVFVPETLPLPFTVKRTVTLTADIGQADDNL